MRETSWGLLQGADLSCPLCHYRGWWDENTDEFAVSGDFSTTGRLKCFFKIFCRAGKPEGNVSLDVESAAALLRM